MCLINIVIAMNKLYFLSVGSSKTVKIGGRIRVHVGKICILPKAGVRRDTVIPSALNIACDEIEPKITSPGNSLFLDIILFTYT